MGFQGISGKLLKTTLGQAQQNTDFLQSFESILLSLRNKQHRIFLVGPNPFRTKQQALAAASPAGYSSKHPQVPADICSIRKDDWKQNIRNGQFGGTRE